MTTINITIPDWAIERDIYIMAGMELMGYHKDGKTFLKSIRCNQCGKCCMDVPDNHFIEKGEDGNCKYLLLDKTTGLYDCKVGPYKPFACCVGEKTILECKIDYKEI